MTHRVGSLLKWMNGHDSTLTIQRRMFWVAFAVRVAFLTLAHKYRLHSEWDHFPFGFEMGRIARALATGRGFSDPFGGHSGPTAWVTPLYPLILALVFKIFGVYSLASAWVILTFNSACSAFTAPAIYEVGWRCFGRTPRGQRLASWSGWLWVFLPAALQYAVHWVWEMSLSTAILAWIFVVALRIRGLEGHSVPLEKRQSVRSWAFFGLLWGLLALSNSSLLTFLPFCAAWIAWHEVRGHFASVVRNAIVAGACFSIVITPWVARNWYVFHVFLPMRSNFGAELFESARFSNEGFPTMATLPLTDRHPDTQEYLHLGEVMYSRKKGSEAAVIIREHPKLFLLHALKRFIFFWDGVPDPVYNLKSLISEALRELNYSFLSIGGLLGLGLALKNRVPGAWLFFWAFVSIPTLYYFISVQARFRHPLEPSIIILLVYLFQSAERSPKKSSAVAETVHAGA